VPFQDSRLAHQFEQLHPRLARMIASLVELRLQTSLSGDLCFSAFRFFVRTIEIHQGEGDIFRKALQSLTNSGVNVPRSRE